MKRPHNRLSVAAVAAIVGLLALGIPQLAEAHAQSKKKTFPAGSRATIAFEVGHGRDGSPTTKVAVKLPSDVTKPAAKNPSKWTSSIDKNVVTWEGGPLGAKG